MEITGYIKDISRSINGETIVSISVDDANMSELRELSKISKLAVLLKKYRKKRSLDANAYHWVLCNKLADALESDSDSIHYDLMVRYGEIIRNDDGTRAVISVLPEVDMRKCNVYARRIGVGTVGEKEFVHYALIKPSRLYDSKEMATLISGTILEAKEAGIETLSPAEISAMMEALKKREK